MISVETIQRHQDRLDWARLSVAASRFLWVVESLVFGWNVSRWSGLFTTVLVVFFCAAVPSTTVPSRWLLRISLWSFMHPVLGKLPWLYLVYHFWLVERIPYPIVGTNPVGSAVHAALLYMGTSVVVFIGKVILLPWIRWLLRRANPLRPRQAPSRSP